MSYRFTFNLHQPHPYPPTEVTITANNEKHAREKIKKFKKKGYLVKLTKVEEI